MACSQRLSPDSATLNAFHTISSKEFTGERGKMSKNDFFFFFLQERRRSKQTCNRYDYNTAGFDITFGATKNQRLEFNMYPLHVSLNEAPEHFPHLVFYVWGGRQVLWRQVKPTHAYRTSGRQSRRKKIRYILSAFLVPPAAVGPKPLSRHR